MSSGNNEHLEEFMAKLLIVDEDTTSRNALARILKQAGQEVVLAADGAEAVSLYERGVFALVFSGIFMPGKEGLETIRELREKDCNARIVAVGGGSKLSSQLALNRAKELGALCTVSKPYRQEEILQVLRETLASA